ncbi:NACHT domain-containing protein [Madurella fahalii]|uniref:NACHT domain-containing protein n=1 Tax=Madurella fahalii TaxID=1157608 RepID=A0ABQ0GHG0_9PEZI
MSDDTFPGWPRKRLRRSSTASSQEPDESRDEPPTTASFATSAQGSLRQKRPRMSPQDEAHPSKRLATKTTTRIVLESASLYTIGWIAALDVERAAATGLLDERHDEPRGFSQPPSDANSYIWGRMGKHNIVIVSLDAGGYGITSAATAASSLMSSLPNIKIGLLVGIGGGIARPDDGIDIRLGDVVVSQPDGATGGVVQYDLAKAKSNNERERKDFLNKPPSVLLRALTALRAEHLISGSKIPSLLEEMWTAYPQMAKSTKTRPGFVHQGPETDRLFRASCQHVGGSDCRKCDPNGELHRDVRSSTDPEVHYGVIASGNLLVKDAATRDQLAEYFGQECLCVEMEAAGLMNHFPCIVIRGISDYADSHKNDRWQRYASATAAAFGKELLDYVRVENLQETRRAAELLQSIETNMQDIHAITSSTNTGVGRLESQHYLDKLTKWLSPPDPSTNLNAAKERHHEGTGGWFIENTTFLGWKSGFRRHLWLHGLAGCGKTVLTSAILDHLQDTQRDSSIRLVFFFDFNNKRKQYLDDLLRSFALQLYAQAVDSQQELDSLFASHRDGRDQPTTESLSKAVHAMMQHPPKLEIVLDALDECTTRSGLLKWLEILSSSELKNIRLIVTSRREDELESGLQWIGKDNMIDMDRNLVNEDIRSYVQARLQSSTEFRKRWASRPDVLEEIESVIGEKSDGMFRWAACQLDILEQCLDYYELQNALRSLPQDLNETYSRILMSIPDQRKETALRILQFLTYSKRPLTLEEAVDAIAIREGRFDPKCRLPCPREITRYSAEYWTDHAKPVETLDDVRESIMDFFENHTAYKIWRYIFDPDRPWKKRPRPKPDTAPPLYFASLSGLIAVAQMLLEKGADVNIQGGHYGNALQAASFKGYNKIVQILLDKGADVNIQGGAYGNALQAASFGGHDKIVRILLDKDADVNIRGGYYSNALQAASFKGYDKIVQILLDKDADVNIQDGYYGNALQAASSNGHDKIVQILLDKGADVNIQGGAYGNALQAASFGGHDKIVQILLDKGADVNI